MKNIRQGLSNLSPAERRELLEGATSQELIERMQSIDEWRKKHLEELKKNARRNLHTQYCDLDLDLTKRRHGRAFEAYIDGLLDFITNQLEEEVEVLIAYYPVSHASI